MTPHPRSLAPRPFELVTPLPRPRSVRSSLWRRDQALEVPPASPSRGGSPGGDEAPKWLSRAPFPFSPRGGAATSLSRAGLGPCWAMGKLERGAPRGRLRQAAAVPPGAAPAWPVLHVCECAQWTVGLRSALCVTNLPSWPEADAPPRRALPGAVTRCTFPSLFGCSACSRPGAGKRWPRPRPRRAGAAGGDASGAEAGFCSPGGCVPWRLSVAEKTQMRLPERGCGVE